ncbi:DUF3119 family protein [Quillaja saponaria]|uniref:DUF3119 family protein n=1 Tax=Quillaja saponaria TaxID=32244 RepID=A0AAD7QCH5_QUISA|nr:DUF3119 family protein [Quillaja saponaria]
MASTLLSVSRFIPSHKKEKVGFLTNFRREFCGQVGCNRVVFRRGISSGHGSRLVVTSLIGRRIKSRETVIPEPDYRIPIVLLGIAGGLVYTENILPAAPVGLLGLLLLFQTTRVRFVFDDEALEVKVGEQLDDSGENVFVGGKKPLEVLNIY